MFKTRQDEQIKKPIVGLLIYPPMIFSFIIYCVICATLFQAYVFLFDVSNNAHSASAWDLFCNVFLLLLFAFQHSLMASTNMKQWWNHSQIAPLQRISYNLVSCITLEILMTYWTPLNPVLWNIPESWYLIVQLIYTCGWILIFFQTLSVDHFELLGIKQVYYAYNGWSDPISLKHPFTRRLYFHLRHPFIVGLLIILWVTPILTLDRFLLGIGFTFYQLVANGIDERDILNVQEELESRMNHLKQQ